MSFSYNECQCQWRLEMATSSFDKKFEISEEKMAEIEKYITSKEAELKRKDRRLNYWRDKTKHLIRQNAKLYGHLAKVRQLLEYDDEKFHVSIAADIEGLLKEINQ